MKYILTITLFLFVSTRALAQESAATVFGHVKLDDPNEAGNMLFGMQDVTSGTIIEAEPPDTSGAFEFPLLPFATYDLYVREEGRSIFLRRMVISSPVPIYLDIDSIPSEGAVEPPIGSIPFGAHTEFTVPVIPQLPVANTVDGVEAIQQNTPGITPDEDGLMHLRGEDPAPQLVVDGIPISSEETRAGNPLFDASLVESADVLRGSLGPHYGDEGILNLATKSGFDATSFGHAEYSIGTNGNSSEGVDLGGRGGNIFAYYGSYGNFSTDRYLDPISGPDPNHTSGTGSDYFGNFDILPAKDWAIHVLGYYGATQFQVPNLSTNSLQDQEESLISTIFSARVDYNASPNSVLSAMGYTRRNDVNVGSNDVNAITDSMSLGAAALSDRYFIGAQSTDYESGGQLSYSARTDWFGARNDFNIAAEAEIDPLQELLTFAATNPIVSDSVLGDPRLIPYDLTKGGQPFLVDTSATGKRISAYADDRITSGPWIINPGLRYDLFELFDNQSGLSPRLNLGYRVSDFVMLRASYNHIFEQAPLENILASSSSEAAALDGTQTSIVQAEKSDNFELGANWSLSKYVGLDVSGYYKSLNNMLASFQLGNSGLFLPANSTSGTIYGGELELQLRDWNHLSGLLSLSSSVSKAAVPASGSPFDAGLVFGGLAQSYSDASIGQSSFNTEWAEPFSASFLLRYQPATDFFVALDGRFDNGLPFGLADTNGAAPDAARSQQILDSRGVSNAAISLLDLNSTTAVKSIAPHAIFNFSIGYNVSQFGLPIMISGSVVNIFNTTCLDHFDPVSGGAYYGMGRSFLLQGQLSP